MDTFPSSDIPAQEMPAQPSFKPAVNLASNSTQQPPQKKKSFRKFFNISSWIFLFVLLPVTVLIFLSQDSIPGDFFYPVKRNLENVVLAAASVSPTTRAAFRTDLTERRFKEAQSLVLIRSNANGLSGFIDEVQEAKLEVTNLRGNVERNKAEEKLISKIEEYQTGLSTLQAKTEQNVIAYQLQETPTSTPPPTGGPPTPTPTSSQTPRVINAQPSSTPIPSLSLAPTIASNIQIAPQESVQVSEQKKIAQTLRETKEQLDKIKKDLEEKRREEKEKHEERNESEKKDKKHGERKDNSDQDK